MFIRNLSYILIFVCGVANATESDGYTHRKLILKKDNAAPVVEKMVNQLITAAVNEANINNTSDTPLEKRVIQATRKRLASDNFGVLAAIVQKQSPFQVYGIPVTPLEWVLDQQNIESERKARSVGVLDFFVRPSAKAIQALNWGSDFDSLLEKQFPLSRYGHRTPLKESIFKTLNIFESGMSAMPGIMFVASININDQVIGVDKLGHFFAQGFSYYQSRSEGQSIKRILRNGKKEEEGSFGKGVFGVSTFGSGVVSYADLAANFHGMSFWQSLLGGTNPLVEIRNGYARHIRDFTFSDYPVYSWDEAINISSHHGLAANDIRTAISNLGYLWYQPIDKKKFNMMKKLNCASFYTSAVLNISSQCVEIEKVSYKD